MIYDYSSGPLLVAERNVQINGWLAETIQTHIQVPFVFLEAKETCNNII